MLGFYVLGLPITYRRAALACARGSDEACDAVWLVCDSGMPGAVGEALRQFRFLRPGTLVPAVSPDVEWAYFIYFNEAGAGFYLAMRNAKFNDPDCAYKVREALLREVREVLWSDPNRDVVLYIIGNAMFPAL